MKINYATKKTGILMYEIKVKAQNYHSTELKHFTYLKTVGNQG